MIERDMLTYLQATPSVTMYIPVASIYVVQALSGAKMPWLVIEPTGDGSRKKITPNKIEEKNNVRFTVDCAPDAKVYGRTAIEAVLKAVEDYRGDLNLADDVTITCSPIRGWASYTGEIYRWQFTAKISFIESL